ncbi:Ger(x)C family spore germination protein [Bacillus mobilis]|uniref:Ger(x)C family spore germination protein n=1 Tax=Bacillus mobilis TaxID=2026190 RepID=UPI003D010B17
MTQNLKIRKIIIRLTLIVFPLLLTGCWSGREIEELGFAMGLAIDKEQETKIEKEIEEEGGGYKNKKHAITTTYQFVRAQSSSNGGKGGVAQQKAYMNVSETGDSLHQSIREVALRRQRPIIFDHTKVIVVSEDIVRTYNITQLMDFFIRDNEMRPSCLVIVSKGLARDALKSKEPGEIPAFRLLEIEDNRYRTSRLLAPVSLAKLPGKVKSGGSFLLPNVISINGEVKYVGAAVIKGSTKKLRGCLNESELEGLTWITANGKGGLVKSYDKKTKKPVMYEIKSIKGKIKSHVKGEKISFDVNVQSVGRISESWASDAAFKNAFLKRAEQTTEQEVKRLVHHTLQKIQKEYKTDVAGFSTSLKIEYPEVWKKVEKNWDKVFSKTPIKYNVKLTIEDYGTKSA